MKASKLSKAIFYFAINPILFFKYITRNLFLFLTPRPLFFKRLKNNPYKNIKGVLFGIDQINPLTQKGIIDSYSDYLTIEKGVMAVYFNVAEIDVAQTISKYLRRGDIFFDVGANFGNFSALAASYVGKTGKVHMFDPSPTCFEKLDELKSLNPGYDFVVNKVAVGNLNGKLNLMLSPPPHLSSHTLVPRFLTDRNIKVFEETEVPVIRLDKYIKEKNTIPKLIKIDVEGYEFMVLQGLEEFFKNNENRPIIICEISPNSYLTLGHTLDDLYQFMRSYGYEAFYSWNSAIKIKNILNPMGNNVVFKALNKNG